MSNLLYLDNGENLGLRNPMGVLPNDYAVYYPGEGVDGDVAISTSSFHYLGYWSPVNGESRTWAAHVRRSSILNPTLSMAIFGHGNRSGYMSNPAYWDAMLEWREDDSLRLLTPTAFQTAPGFLSRDVWYHIEYRCSTSSAEVYVNGVLVLSGSGTSAHMMSWAALYGAARTVDFSHVILGDDLPENIAWSKVRYLAPGGTSAAGWTGSDGDQLDNHLLVDDFDPASADYVEAVAGSGAKDKYTHASVTPGATVYAVQPCAAASLDTVGVDDFAVLIDSNGTEVEVPAVLGAGPASWYSGPTAIVDPDTGLPWTESGFNAMTFGVRS